MKEDNKPVTITNRSVKIIEINKKNKHCANKSDINY